MFKNRKTVVKLLIGIILFSYAIYACFAGEIFTIPSRHGNLEWMISDGRLIYYVLGYIAFSLVFFTWAFPDKYKRNRKARKKGVFRLLKTPREIMIATFLALGFMLPLIGNLVKLTGVLNRIFG